MKTLALIQYLLLLASVSASNPLWAGETTDKLLQHYLDTGASVPDEEQGRQLWQSKHNGRSCSGCHNSNVRQPGRHLKTAKVIAPMAPSVNPQRLTNPRKVEKWFYRNCKWTLGRECTPQEKANVLLWLSKQ